MESRRSWIVPCHLGPFTSADWAIGIGMAMGSAVLIGCHVVVPLDIRRWADRLIVVNGMLPDAHVLHVADRAAVVVYSRRHHDIIDERDAAHTLILGSWLASSGIELADWVVVTSRSARSIPADFGLPRLW